VTAGERIESLDILRGVALLGILFMNIQFFSMIGAAYFNPSAYGDLGGINQVVWVLSHIFTDQKFMTIFSMLFGAGILLMSQKAEASGRRPAGLHYRRMFWLLLFGMAHGYLLWPGDILFLYGLCGLVAYIFRKMRPGWLLLFGLLSLAFCSGLWFLCGWSMQFWPSEQIAAFANDWAPGPELVEAELAAYRSGWAGQMGQRAMDYFGFQTGGIIFWGAWRAGGLMLIGMALFKLGIFSAERSRRFYRIMIVPALVIALPAIVLGIVLNFRNAWDVTYSFFLGSQFNYWGSILVSLAYTAIVMLIIKTGALRALTARLAAVGRMALSMYLLHSIICTTIFYGHGLGLFGRVERIWQLAITLGVIALQLWIAPRWLKRFRFGPFEWLWRTLTYMRPQPMRVEIRK
jgi:uncharacterized protein